MRSSLPASIGSAGVRALATRIGPARRDGTQLGSARDEVEASFVNASVIALEPVERDPETFEELYARHERDVMRYAVFLVRDPDEGADVAAEAFTRAFDAWRSGRLPTGRPLPWLFLITRRIVIDRRRRQRLLRWIPLRHAAAQEPSRNDALARHEFWLWLDRLAAGLSERQREVLFLRYRRDLTDVEIARLMGITASGVRSLLARAIKALRDHPELLR